MHLANDRFAIRFVELYLNPKVVTEAELESSNWKVTFSNQDRTWAHEFVRKDVMVAVDGYLSLNLIYGAHGTLPDLTKWRRKGWLKGYRRGPDWSSRWKDYNPSEPARVGARTKSLRGAPGKKLYVKVQLETKRLKGRRHKGNDGFTGYATINVPEIIGLYFNDEWREKYIRIDLPDSYGYFSLLAYPVLVADRGEKRVSRRTRASSQFDLLKLAKHKNLPACCRNSLKSIQVQMSLLAKIAKAYKYKAWVEKVGDAKWITDTKEKIKDEAINEIKSRLKLPGSGGPSREDVLTRLAALTISDAVAKTAFLEKIHHSKSKDADLRKLWSDIHNGFQSWNEQLVREKPEWERNVAKAVVRQVVSAVGSREL